MTSLSFPGASEQRRQNVLTALWGSNWLLMATVVLYAGLFGLMIGLSAVDGREVLGVPVWIKPLKFSISMALYAGTLAWMLSFVRSRRLAKLVGHVSGLFLVAEFALIFWQAARGVPSHFNHATPFDTMIFRAMGGLILVVWSMNLLAAILLLFQRMEDPALAWSFRLGLLLTALGAALGYLMIGPTPAQLTLLQSGEALNLIGAHSVGIAEGGPGLPFLGWSMTGGDLRIPHFVGLHAMQILPLSALLLRRFGRLSLAPRTRTRLVWVLADGYLGLIALVLWQALRGQPLLAPDGWTLAALAGLIGVMSVGAAAVMGLDRLRA